MYNDQTSEPLLQPLHAENPDYLEKFTKQILGESNYPTHINCTPKINYSTKRLWVRRLLLVIYTLSFGFVIISSEYAFPNTFFGVLRSSKIEMMAIFYVFMDMMVKYTMSFGFQITDEHRQGVVADRIKRNFKAIFFGSSLGIVGMLMSAGTFETHMLQMTLLIIPGFLGFCGYICGVCFFEVLLYSESFKVFINKNALDSYALIESTLGVPRERIPTVFMMLVLFLQIFASGFAGPYMLFLAAVLVVVNSVVRYGVKFDYSAEAGVQKLLLLPQYIIYFKRWIFNFQGRRGGENYSARNRFLNYLSGKVDNDLWNKMSVALLQLLNILLLVAVFGILNYIFVEDAYYKSTRHNAFYFLGGFLQGLGARIAAGSFLYYITFAGMNHIVESFTVIFLYVVIRIPTLIFLGSYFPYDPVEPYRSLYYYRQLAH